MKNNFYKKFDKKMYTKITRFEKFCLFFVKAKYSVEFIGLTKYIAKYKVMNGKYYLIKSWATYTGGYMCRHKIIPIEQK